MRIAIVPGMASATAPGARWSTGSFDQVHAIDVATIALVSRSAEPE